MRSNFIWRFTPSRTEPLILEDVFVQRESLLKDIVERVKESATTGDKHFVVLVGPRGIGKTHFVSLVHHRISGNKPLSKKLRIASRQSPLALIQVEEAIAHLKPILPEDTEFEIVKLSTPGDHDQTTSLTDPEVPDDFFTRSIDDCLLNGDAELSVHSAKDLPDNPRKGPRKLWA